MKFLKPSPHALSGFVGYIIDFPFISLRKFETLVFMSPCILPVSVISHSARILKPSVADSPLIRKQYPILHLASFPIHCFLITPSFQIDTFHKTKDLRDLPAPIPVSAPSHILRFKKVPISPWLAMQHIFILVSRHVFSFTPFPGSPGILKTSIGRTFGLKT